MRIDLSKHEKAEGGRKIISNIQTNTYYIGKQWVNLPVILDLI